jgi:hypothetical protein
VRTVTATTQIDAPAMDVWAILADLSSYPQWNPLFPEASGEVVKDGRIQLTTRQPGTGRMMTIKPRILVAEPGAELRWAASVPGLIGGEHSFVLTAQDGGTRLVHSESFTGLLVAFAAKTLAAAQESYAEMNEALKRRAEAAK